MIDEVVLLITDDRDLKPYIYRNGNWVSDPRPGGAQQARRPDLLRKRRRVPAVAHRR